MAGKKNYRHLRRMDYLQCPRFQRYYTQKLQEQMDVLKGDGGDREAESLWPRLKEKMPSFFDGLDIKPALMHGDLWSGNVGQVNDEGGKRTSWRLRTRVLEIRSSSAIFDPGSFYGHHEYDLGIAGMFGMSSQFFEGYHSVIPKERGFETRHQLYQLFHYMNHW